MKYTFSTREKFMLVVLGLIAIGFAWYQFLYTPIQNKIADIEAQTQETQDEILMRQTVAATMESQQAAIAQWEAEGVKPMFLPAFDNTQQLMAFLNGTLSATDNYSMSFDNPSIADDGTVHRLGTITFTIEDYKSARSVVEAIARGPYPCKVSALGVADKTVDSSNGSGDVSVNMQVTFFERITAETDLEKEDEGTEIQGNDWSQVINRDQ